MARCFVKKAERKLYRPGLATQLASYNKLAVTLTLITFSFFFGFRRSTVLFWIWSIRSTVEKNSLTIPFLFTNACFYNVKGTNPAKIQSYLTWFCWKFWIRFTHLPLDYNLLLVLNLDRSTNSRWDRFFAQQSLSRQRTIVNPRIRRCLLNTSCNEYQ